MLAAGEVQAALDAADELIQMAGAYSTPALRAMANHARGRCCWPMATPAALVALRGAWQLWRELQAPYEAARVRVLVGLACRQLGDREAAAMEFDARTVFAQLGAAPDLARVEALARSGAAPNAQGLTERELQVLRLLATGKTNHAIANELVLSEKTVHRHVSNIFTKLHVSSRAAATAYAYSTTSCRRADEELPRPSASHWPVPPKSSDPLTSSVEAPGKTPEVRDAEDRRPRGGSRASLAGLLAARVLADTYDASPSWNATRSPRGLSIGRVSPRADTPICCCPEGRRSSTSSFRDCSTTSPRVAPRWSSLAELASLRVAIGSASGPPGMGRYLPGQPALSGRPGARPGPGPGHGPDHRPVRGRRGRHHRRQRPRHRGAESRRGAVGVEPRRRSGPGRHRPRRPRRAGWRRSATTNRRKSGSRSTGATRRLRLRPAPCPATSSSPSVPNRVDPPAWC